MNKASVLGHSSFCSTVFQKLRDLAKDFRVLACHLRIRSREHLCG